MSDEELSIRLRLALLERIVREAQADGDERWRRVHDEQIEPLREQLRALLTCEGRYPPPVQVIAQAGAIGAEGSLQA